MSYRGGPDRGRGYDRGRGSRGSSPGGGRGSPGGEGYRGRGRGDGGGGDGYRGRGRGDGGGGDGYRGRGGYQDRGGGGRGFDRGGGRGRGGPPREQGGVFAAGVPANLDARLADNSLDQLVASFRSLTVQENDLPIRPDFGKAGQAIKLRTNFFPVKVPKGPLFEYDVSITPAVTIKRVKRRIWQIAEKTNEWGQAGMLNTVAHDHSSKLISAKLLPQPLEIQITLVDEDDEVPAQPSQPKGGKKDAGKKGAKPDNKEYTLTFKFIQEIETQSLINYLNGQPRYRDYDIMPIISALNIILAAHPNRSSGAGVMVGRNKFFHPSETERPFSIGGGLEAWRGFYSSVRPAYKQLMVNVNACTTAFYVPGNLADRLHEFMQASFSARPNAFAKGIRVRTIHLGYRKTVKTVAKVTARQHSFDAEGMGKVTVEQYFKKKYNITLKYPDLPLIDVGGQKTNYLPAECCVVLEKQPYKGKLLDEHTAEMIKVACRPPNANAQSIVDRGISELGFKDTADPMNAFGISVGTQMAVVPGRILPSPNIRYGQGAPRVDERASWNLRDVKFAVPGKLSNWAVLLIRDGGRDEFDGPNDPELRTVMSGFMQMCKTSGMTVDNAPPKIVQAELPPKDRNDPIRKNAITAIRNAVFTVKPKPALFFVILSNGDRHVYSGLKHLCDVYLDVATVCVHSAKIRKEKGQVQFYANVALKVNMKMGGVNHTLDDRNASSTWFKKEPTMLVGMDVTHPGFGTVKGTPSIAAVVASTDRYFGQFPASLRIQESKKEMITDLAEMMVERLNAFKAKSNVLPTRVVVYRDGVSEGQFHIVVAEELPEIKAAFKKFGNPNKPYTPKLTIVICGKRHHTRFYPTDAQHADRDGNPRPGTVVDRGITAVYDFDFFLQAHGGLQGTTRPTHYYVVHDDIGFKADELQGLTNDVSYMFARATKAVSLVSPAYYADLACERGRCYLHALLSGISGTGTTATSGAGEDEVMTEAKQMWRTGIGGQLKETMFYI